MQHNQMGGAAGLGRDRFTERDRFFIPAVQILAKLADGGHQACKLTDSDLTRDVVDRSLAWLKRRKLVHYDGVWKLTGLGIIATRANKVGRTPQGYA